MLKAYTCIWSNKSAAEMVKFYKLIEEQPLIKMYTFNKDYMYLNHQVVQRQQLQ